MFHEKFPKNLLLAIRYTLFAGAKQLKNLITLSCILYMANRPPPNPMVKKILSKHTAPAAILTHDVSLLLKLASLPKQQWSRRPERQTILALEKISILHRIASQEMHPLRNCLSNQGRLKKRNTCPPPLLTPCAHLVPAAAAPIELNSFLSLCASSFFLARPPQSPPPQPWTVSHHDFCCSSRQKESRSPKPQTRCVLCIHTHAHCEGPGPSPRLALSQHPDLV